MSNKTYMEQCLAGEVLYEEIDDFVKKWHLDKNAKGSLGEYLGFSHEEYKLWAEQPNSLRFIIFAHKSNVPIQQAIKEQSIAARSESQTEAEKILLWLKKTGRLD